MMQGNEKYSEVEPIGKALDGEKCHYCNSTNTTWCELMECEVSFYCNGCGEGFVVEFCFLSDKKQKAIRDAKQ